MAVLAAWPVGSAPAAITPLSEFGSPGTGAGQITSPEGIAIDGSGRVYVADVSRARIAVFSADGSFIHAFGRGVRTGGSGFEVCTTATGCLPGLDGSGAAGEVNGPRGIALDGAGHLYVAEDDAPRISVFNTAGPSFLRAFGFGVDTGASTFQTCTTASGCMSGVSGADAGQLSFAHDVLLDGAGNLYVTDSGNHRVSVYNTAGPSFVRSFGYGVLNGDPEFQVCTATCLIGLAGDDAGQLEFPKGLALADTGRLYVSEQSNNRISVFDTPVPSFVHAFGQGVATGGASFEVCTSSCMAGTAASGAGSLNGPLGLALDESGDLLVVEPANHRVSSFSTGTPSFLSAFGFGVDTGASAFEICTTASTCQMGAMGGAPGAFNTPHDVAIDVCGDIWVDDQTSRVQRFGEPGTRLPPSCSATPSRPPKCAGRNVTSFGSPGPDALKGTPKADVIAGLGGNDRLRGLAGNDVLCGGKGRDRLIGGRGRDRLLGQAGRDVCRGGPKRDRARSCEVRKTI
jgi:DNA-binding beta-propeller fold protein YncE